MMRFVSGQPLKRRGGALETATAAQQLRTCNLEMTSSGLATPWRPPEVRVIKCRLVHRMKIDHALNNLTKRDSFVFSSHL